MKKIAFIFTFLLIAGTLFSKTVSVEEATLVCQNFMKEYFLKNDDRSPILSDTKMAGNIPVFYRFQFSQPGFIIVSASDLASPILAYSFESDFEENPNTAYFFNRYSFEIQYLEKNRNPASPEVQNEWAHYLQTDFTPKASKNNSFINPLITTKWDQNRYYNTYCPWDAAAGRYYDFRVPNGCVALAMAMLMTYYRYPASGNGGFSYEPAGYPRQTVRFSDHTYNYDVMCNQPQFYTNEIAKLIYHCGVAVEMGYSPSGSGAHTSNALAKLRSTFGYAQAFISSRSIYLDSTAWMNRLKRELDSLRPLYYSGNDGSSGHAFIVDGYDVEDLFHVNWGWGGSNNGYYRIQYLAPGGYGNGFNFNEDVILNLYPSSNYPKQCAGHVRNTASSGHITNGSTNKKYAANSDCSWMVATPDAVSYTFSFSRLDTEEGQDFVTIYNGPTLESGIAGRYSGGTLPVPVTVTADSVLITFTSNATVQGNGFLIDYNAAILPAFCGTRTITEYSGEISDESQDEKYRSRSNCSWEIEPDGISKYVFTFSQFNLGSGDFVDFYDNTTNPPTFFKRFDRNSSPSSSFECNFSKVLVNFISDNWDNGEGFLLEWNSVSEINEESCLKNIAVFPNPANDYLTVSFSTESPGNIQCKILDMTGKTMYNEHFKHLGGDFSHKLSTDNLAPGLYLLHIETPTGKAIKKIAVN